MSIEKETFESNRWAECAVCGAIINPVEHDIPEDEEDTGLPVGWVEVVVRTVVPNPAAEVEAAHIAEAEATQRDVIEAQVQQSMMQVPPEAREQAKSQISKLREAITRIVRLQFPVGEPEEMPLTVVEFRYAVCPQHASKLVQLGMEELADVLAVPVGSAPFGNVPTVPLSNAPVAATPFVAPPAAAPPAAVATQPAAEVVAATPQTEEVVLPGAPSTVPPDDVKDGVA